MNPANIFVPLSWFFGTIFVTVLTVKLLNLLWSKRDQFPWIKRHAHGDTSMPVLNRTGIFGDWIH